MILGSRITDPWKLERSVRQGCPLSALLYAVATHPLLIYLDHLTASDVLHGLQLPNGKQFLAQAFADGSFCMPRNSQSDVQRSRKD